MKPFKYIPNVVDLQLDENKCNACGVCIQVCPHRVFSMKNKKAEIVDRDLCMECGACSNNCMTHAITVSKGVGCATAIIYGFFRKSEPTCGCGNKVSC